MGSAVSSIFGGGSGGSTFQAQQTPTYATDPSKYNPYASQLGSALSGYQSADPLAQLRGLMSGNITAQPGYQYALQQGLSGTAAQAASQGRAVSGNELAALNAQGSGIASQQYQNLFSNALSQQNLVTNQLQGNVSNYLNASSNAANWQSTLTGMTQANNQGMAAQAQAAQAQQAQNAGGAGILSSLIGGGLAYATGGLTDFFGSGIGTAGTGTLSGLTGTELSDITAQATANSANPAFWAQTNFQ